MKELICKFIQTSSGILISIIHGILYAQQVCCSTIVNACIPSSNGESVNYGFDNSYRTSPSNTFNNQLLSNLCSNNFLGDFGSGNACCETDRCDWYNQSTYFSLSLNQNFYPLQKKVSSFDAGDGVQTTFEPSCSLPTSHKAVPIYIMTQSIIC
jgi:hypothetical protein